MLAALFVFGSIGFWAITVISMLILLALVEYERSGWALITLAVVTSLIVLGNVGLIPFIVANPAGVLLALCAYIIVGAAWSLAKWVLFVKDRKEKFIEAKAKRRADIVNELRIGLKRDPTDEEISDTFKERFSKNARYDRRTFGMPVPSEHKGRIIHWMAYWPWSMLNSLIFDFIRRFFKHIYNLLADIYRKISESIYKDILDETGDDSGTI